MSAFVAYVVHDIASTVSHTPSQLMGQVGTKKLILFGDGSTVRLYSNRYVEPTILVGPSLLLIFMNPGTAIELMSMIA